MKYNSLNRIVAILAICVVLIISNASAESPTRMYYTDNFTIEIPEHWIHINEDETGNECWVYADSIGSITGGYLYIYEQKLGVSISSEEDLVSVYDGVITGISSGTDVISSVTTEKITIDNKLAYQFGYDSSLIGGLRIEGYIVANNGALLSVSYTDDSGSTESIKEIANSFAAHTYCGIVEEGLALETSALKTSQEKSIDDYYAMYSEAEYERYNSYAYENGLGGDLIQFEGIISEYIRLDGAYGFILTQEDGENWLVLTGYENSISPEIFEGYQGKNVRIYGEYAGFSDVYKMPSVDICVRGGFYSSDDATFIGTFADVNKEMKEWMKARASRETFSYRNDYEYSWVMCEGLITEVTRYDTIESVIISFVQKIESGFSSGWISEDYADYPILRTLNYGDSIELYYFRPENKDFVLAFIDTPEVPALTIEEYQDAYKSQCNEYTFKGIARNPEKVKGEYAVVTGEVIQVLEDGDTVNLRVNITEESWGYTDTIYVVYTRKDSSEDRILEDDIITIWGKLSGLETYESTWGKQITLPRLDAEYIRIDSLY